MNKKLFSLIAVCSCILFSSCDGGSNFSPPAQKNENDPNEADIVYPVKTFSNRMGTRITGYMYVVDGDTIIIGTEGGVAK